MTVKDFIWKMIEEVKDYTKEARISIMCEDGEVYDFPIHDIKVGSEDVYIRNFPRDENILYEEE